MRDTTGSMWDKILATVVLLLWAAVLLILLNGGRYRYFVRPAFGAGLVTALFVCMLFYVAVMRSSRAHEKTSRIATLTRAGVLILPLIYAMSAGNTVLDSDAFAKRWVVSRPKVDSTEKAIEPQATAMNTEDDAELVEMYRSSQPRRIPKALRRMLGLPPEEQQTERTQKGAKEKGVLPASLYDLAEYGDRYGGRRISTEGMVAWDEESKNRFYLFRFVVVCCVADAQPVAVLVECQKTQRPAPNTWVRVEGAAEIIKVNGQQGVVVKGASIQAIRVPRDPYLY